MNIQEYNEVIERLSQSILKVMVTFIFLPFLICLFTDISYWYALPISIITIMIKNYIVKYVKERRKKDKEANQ